MKNLLKLLEVKGKKISILLADGNWWIPVRPICDALEIDYHAQYKKLKGDKITSRVLSNQTTHDASNRLQEMVCIKERYVYGWLFGIQSDSEELLEFKLECYDVLFNHFHGRLTALTERVEIDEEIARLESALENTTEFQSIKALQQRKEVIKRSLAKMDKDLVKGQIKLDM